MGVWGFLFGDRRPRPGWPAIEAAVRAADPRLTMDGDLIMLTRPGDNEPLPQAVVTLNLPRPGKPIEHTEHLRDHAEACANRERLLHCLDDARWCIVFQWVNVGLSGDDALFDPLLEEMIERYDGVYCNDDGRFFDRSGPIG